MPGHTTSIAESHPELIIARNVQPNWPEFAAQPPSGTLKLNDPKVDKFNTKLLNDLLPRLKDYTPYYHTGGDEVNAHAYLLEEGIQSEDKTKIQPHINRFVTHLHDVVRENGMSPVVWEEMLLVWNITLAKDTIVQSWTDPESVKLITGKGYRVIAGSYKHWYLDCGKGQWLDFKPRDFAEFYPFQDYCAPVHNWRASKSHLEHTIQLDR
jgi:hexosaminidase